MDSPKRVLILTADAGFGHRSAANAVAAALKEAYPDQCLVKIVNPMDDKRIPSIVRDSQSDYDRMVRTIPEFYRFGYEASDAPIPIAIFESTLTIIFYEVLQELLNSFHPDVIFSTYPLYQEPLSAIFKIQRNFIPLLAAVTDLVTVHRIWYNTHVDNLLVPNQIVYDAALASRVPEYKLKITGIPVNPNCAHETRSETEIRTSLGWRTDLPTILAVGSRRVENLVDSLNIINHFGMPLQLIVVAGKDEELYQQLQSTEWHIPVKLYPFVENMPEMMHAADLLVSKAGGLIVTESLACGLPLLLINAIPGQETGNAQLVVDHSAGDLALAPIKILETLSHLFMDDGKLLKERAQCARKLGQPHSASLAADLIWQAAQRGPISKHHILGRPILVDFLKQNHISLQRSLFYLDNNGANDEHE